MGRHDIDLLEGFDGRQIVYDEEKEKKYQARIWWFFLGIAIFILVRGFIFHVGEMKMKTSWNVIEATYYESTAQAIYRGDGEEGVYYQYDISGFSAEHDGNKIKLYYEEYIAYAEPVHEIQFWLQTYLIFGLVAVFSGWRVWTIYKK